MSKNKPLTNAQQSTRASLASKVAAMANIPSTKTTSDNGVTMNQLVAEPTKHRTSLKEDISLLIQELIAPLWTSVNALTETAAGFQARLNATESLAGDNFTTLTTAEKTIKYLQEQNATLIDRVEDLENRSRRANLRILNVPEDSEKGQATTKFVSELLKEVMGEQVFDKAPELERAHRSLGQKPLTGQPPWYAFIGSKRRKKHYDGP